MLGKFFDQILDEDEEAVAKVAEKTEKEKIKKRKISWKILFWPILIFVSALAVRLYFIFFVSNPHNAGVNWYGDTYHRWQVAYLTKEIGWAQGYRLWDLKGMEYFWGILHPFLMNVLFFLTGRVDIWLGRVLTSVAGAGIAMLLYLLAKRYWNQQLALAIGFFAALFSLAVFNDASGSVEPIGLFLLLLGIWFWPRKPVLTGLFWALAAMSRAEVWLFSLGLIGFLVISQGGLERLIKVTFSWLIPMLAYMKYLAIKTGNYIYPLYWNFLVNARGIWTTREQPDAEELAVKPYFITLFILSFLGMIWVLWRKRRSKSVLLLLLFFGNATFVMGMMGLTSYLRAYESWFWMIRFFVFPYILVALLTALFLFYFLPRFLRSKSALVFSFIIWFSLLGFTQLAWQPVMKMYAETEGFWQLLRQIGEEVGEEKIEGKISVPPGTPAITYALVRFGGIQGRDIISQMYDPFAYIEGDPFADWPNNREFVFEWFKRENVKWFLKPDWVEHYQILIEREPQSFELLKKLPKDFYLYEVKI